MSPRSGLIAAAQGVQPLRESTDYGAVQFDAEKAREVIATAHAFLDAVEEFFS